MSLIIDGTSTNREDYSGLSQLKNLRSITWKGMRIDENLEVIQKNFQSIAQHLEYLDLEPVTFFTNDRLRIESLLTDVETLQSPGATPSVTPSFGALLHLCLSRFSLEPDYELLLSTLQIKQLQSLRLRECAKKLEFLEALTRSNRAINLWSFEIVHTAA
jgi:hypothetical protein